MFQWTRDWLKLRREHAAMRHGRLLDLSFDEDTYAFARQTANETIILAFNRAAIVKRINAPAAFAGLADGAELLPLLVAKERARIEGGTITFEVPAQAAVAYLVKAKAR
jgi:glycosidase